MFSSLAQATNFRNLDAHPSRPTLLEETPVDQGNEVEAAFQNLQINDARMKEEKRNPDLSLLEKELFVTSRDSSCSRYLVAEDFFTKRVQEQCSPNSSYYAAITSEMSSEEREAYITKELNEDQRACAEYYQNLIEKRYYELSASVKQTADA